MSDDSVRDTRDWLCKCGHICDLHRTIEREGNTSCAVTGCDCEQFNRAIWDDERIDEGED